MNRKGHTMSHTPGPWTVTHCYNDTDDNIIDVRGSREVPGGLGLLLAHVYPQLLPTGKPGAEEYNARLIAAAPEMLELLERYVKRGDDLSAEYREARALLARLQPDTERKG